MDQQVVLAQPLAAVFGYLAAPARLPGWLPEISAVETDARQLPGIGVTFGLRLQRDGQDTGGTGELIAYEPPWCVGYRLTAGPRAHVLRVTCIASRGATRVSIHQAGPAPLIVDLERLPEYMQVSAEPDHADGRGGGLWVPRGVIRVVDRQLECVMAAMPSCCTLLVRRDLQAHSEPGARSEPRANLRAC